MDNRTVWHRVDATRLLPLAVTAALVGLLAGIAAATFATIAGEPAVDDAIAIEEANAVGHSEDHGGDEAVVDRADQKGVGLFGAYLLTGAAFGGLTALTAHGLRRGRPDVNRRVLMAGTILAGAFTVAPWLKYPPNPPAVGNPDTLAERQSWYVATICIAAAVGIAATIVSRRLKDRPQHHRLPAVVATVVAPMLLAFAVMPPAPDDIPVPATLVWRFRVASLGSNLLLWTTLTLGLVWVLAEARRRVSADEPVLVGA